MDQLAKFGIILGIICLAATMVLALTYEVTKPKIEEQLKREEQAALKEILPDASSFAPKTAGGIEYFDAMKDGALVGYCVKVTGSGYSGYMRMIVGIDTKGVIKGVSILEHQETPGLGSRINDSAPGEKAPYFLRQFRGKPAKTVAIGRDVDAITGATISSKAVTDAINKTVSEFLDKVKP